MKRIFAFLLAMAMLLSLAACSEPESKDRDRDKDKEPVEQTEPTGSTEPEQPPLTAPEDYRGEVLVDNDICTVSVDQITVDPFWGYTLELSLENKTSTAVCFSVSAVSVNGIMCEPLWAVELAAGEKKAGEQISFFETELQDRGIWQVADVSFRLEVTDAEDLWADPLLMQWCSVQPLGQEAVAQYCTHEQPEGQVLLDDEYCTVILTGFDPEDSMGYAMGLYVLSKTDRALRVAMNDVSVNGVMLDPYWGSTLAPRKLVLLDAIWTQEDLKACQIRDLTKIEFTFAVSDLDDWLNTLSSTPAVVYPLGQDAAQDHVHTLTDADTVLVDSEQLSVVVTGMEYNDLDGFCAELYIFNKTDEDLQLFVNSANLNGIDIVTFWGQDVPAGKQAYSQIVWWSYELENNGITKVESVGLELAAYTEDDWLMESPIWTTTADLKP